MKLDALENGVKMKTVLPAASPMLYQQLATIKSACIIILKRQNAIRIVDESGNLVNIRFTIPLLNNNIIKNTL